MALTLDKLRDAWIPKSIYARPNNLSESQAGVAFFNDSINLYDAIILASASGSADPTDLSSSLTSTTVTILSSTGDDVVLSGASTTEAGVMTATDKVNLSGLLTLDGVANGATNLGTFTGSIISDNTTIKAALQELEDAIDIIPSLTFGDLTSSTSAITVSGKYTSDIRSNSWRTNTKVYVC